MVAKFQFLWKNLNELTLPASISDKEEKINLNF